MSVYDKDGAILNSAHAIAGNALNAAYNEIGEQIYPDSTSIKVMTYNVGGWYTGTGTNVPSDKKDVYYALQTGMIENNDPDILIIQEYLANFSADGTSALSMLQSLFPYVHAKTSGTYFGRAICSKYPITNYTERQYTQETSRYFDSCTVTVNGVPVTVITTHLGLSQEDRTLEIAQLIALLETQGRFIAGGDYNTGITAATANTSSTTYTNNVKPFVDKGFNTANFITDGFLITCNDGLPGEGTEWYLDNIYTSSGLTVSNTYVDTTKLTDGLNDKVDHMPLVTTVQIS